MAFGTLGRAMIQTHSSYQLHLPGFSGPLELLLQLIERKGLDITTVSLAQVTDQYLSQVRAQDQIDDGALADFVAIGARLLLIKSRCLLPRPASSEFAPEGHGTDLTQALAEYRRFRDAAALFERRQSAFRSFPRPPVQADLAAPPPSLRLPPLESLASLLEATLSRERRHPAVSLPAELVSIRKMADGILRLLNRAEPASFSRVIGCCRSRIEVVVSFLALLHLVRDGAVEAVQQQPFGAILLTRRSSESSAAAVASPYHPTTALLSGSGVQRES